jgi:hypothetical protein
MSFKNNYRVRKRESESMATLGSYTNVVESLHKLKTNSQNVHILIRKSFTAFLVETLNKLKTNSKVIFDHCAVCSGT